MLLARRATCYVGTEIASFGHSSTHVPQSVHLSGSILATSFKLIASCGHASMQMPQPVHWSLSTFAAVRQAHDGGVLSVSKGPAATFILPFS